LGDEIDPQERDAYHLFPGIDGFASARFLMRGDGRYILEYAYEDEFGLREKRLRISTDMWESAKLHVELVERYQVRRSSPTQDEAEWQYRTALKYAAKGQYAISGTAIEDLYTEFPDSPVTQDADGSRSAINRLASVSRAVFLPASLVDRSGRTDLLIFAGYYGLWAGIATPIALEADSPQAYAVGLIFGVPVSLGVTWALSQDADVGKGRASMISLGGNFGTWQGIGWSAITDAEGQTVVGTGLLAGLGGIAAATLLTRNVPITEGHGSLSGLALPWGTWYGLVLGIVADADGDDLLRATLIGSDALVFAAVVGARNVRMSQGRGRLISLMGVAGAAFGFGIDLMAEVDTEEAVFAIAGAGSVAGLALGVHITRNYDEGKELSLGSAAHEDGGLALIPRLGVKPDPFSRGKLMPTLSWGARF
jgi:hypothetical protein